MNKTELIRLWTWINLLRKILSSITEISAWIEHFAWIVSVVGTDATMSLKKRTTS